MPRALDHIVWPTRDLDGLAAVFQSLGFTVGRQNRHPWGTLNRIVQFDGTFVELLGFADDYEPTGPEAAAEPFAGFCARFLDQRGPGPAMLVLRSQDAEADARRLAAKGLGHGRLLPFSRSAQGPDGADKTVAFTIAFAVLPGLPAIGAFLCQQHRPENFWSPAAQRHANGARGIASITVGGLKPADVGAQALRRFAQADEGAGDVRLADGSRLMLAPGAPPAMITEVAFAVADLSAVERLADAAGIPCRSDGAGLVCGTAASSDRDLAFVQSG
ncbi:VOC family protein [Lichenihabitans sp. Uapishka_5]|uniref:VOC family protein n=1 Tax=Lichenihabitans sp. Uapishka_5 TaxID=3037302 RepID=UPI0029E8014A|nr:VOC family protein [Lichenihabitans sp. Uapishka_5]MDX7952244.1 VOC family protein [Lichenihabitans sp. Uapishka_5]